MRLGVNYPLGPLAWADQIGLVSIRKVLANLGALYGEDRYRISPLIQQLAFQGKKYSWLNKLLHCLLQKHFS